MLEVEQGAELVLCVGPNGHDRHRIIFNPGIVRLAVVSTATLDFTMTPGSEDRALLTYSINGTSVTKAIKRYRI